MLGKLWSTKGQFVPVYSINIPEYAWKSIEVFSELFWLCQGSEYAQSYYLFDNFVKMYPLLNKPGFWIWHSCIGKGYAEFQICLNMPEYTLISLNFPYHWWTLLNVPQYAWINCSDYVRVLNMVRYSYNNIII